MRDQFMFVAVFSFVTLLNAYAADTNEFRYSIGNLAEQEKLKSLVDELFSRTDVISVKSVSRSTELPGEFALRFDITNEWRYGVSFHCRQNCGMESKSLMKYLSSGLNLRGNCPPPFTVLIELEKDAIVEEIFIHDTGHCIKIDNVSYYTESSFFDLAPNSSMHPAFLGR